MSIEMYLMKMDGIFIAGIILFFCGIYMNNLIGNIAGLIGFIMICYALIYADLKEWKRSKKRMK